MTEKNQTPKFRLDDIAKIPENIMDMMREIVAEISQNSNLQPALAGNGNLNYGCNPYCSCNTECHCDDKCSYCRCVDDCTCNNQCRCEDDCFYDGDPCPRMN